MTSLVADLRFREGSSAAIPSAGLPTVSATNKLPVEATGRVLDRTNGTDIRSFYSGCRYRRPFTIGVKTILEVHSCSHYQSAPG